MAVFGPAWDRHEERLEGAWRERVRPEDVVIVAGDISWAMREAEVLPDLRFLASLPGRKVLLKGNHDYWWSTRKRVQALLGGGGYALQTNAVELSGAAIVGARGWEAPGSLQGTDDDARLYARELERLRLSLAAGAKTGRPLIAALHYPPLARDGERTEVSDLLERHRVRQCVYGHLHGAAHRARVEGEIRGIAYHLVAADYLDFTPKQICEL